MIPSLRSIALLASALLSSTFSLSAQRTQSGTPYAAWSFDAKDNTAFVGTGSAPEYQLTASVTGEIARVAGVRGQALQFTQDTVGYLSIPIDLSLVSQGHFSFEVWLRPGSAAKDYETILDSGGHRGFTVRLGAGRRISASLDDKWNLINDTERVTQGEWIHVAATFDGTVFRLYVRGKEIGNHTTNAPLRLGTVLQLGRVNERFRMPDGTHENALVKPLDGELDELKIYTRVLGHEEIVAAANTSR